LGVSEAATSEQWWHYRYEDDERYFRAGKSRAEAEHIGREFYDLGEPFFVARGGQPEFCWDVFGELDEMFDNANEELAGDDETPADRTGLSPVPNDLRRQLAAVLRAWVKDNGGKLNSFMVHVEEWHEVPASADWLAAH
jgi:hypothetical protein